MTSSGCFSDHVSKSPVPPKYEPCPCGRGCYTCNECGHALLYKGKPDFEKAAFNDLVNHESRIDQLEAGMRGKEARLATLESSPDPRVMDRVIALEKRIAEIAQKPAVDKRIKRLEKLRKAQAIYNTLAETDSE